MPDPISYCHFRGIHNSDTTIGYQAPLQRETGWGEHLKGHGLGLQVNCWERVAESMTQNGVKTGVII